MNKSESISTIAGALAKAQGEMKNPAFDAQNPHFKNRYASLAAVRDSVVPILSKHGIAVIQSLRATEGGIEVETMLAHSSGEWLSDVLALPATKHDAQGLGSSATYARRYSLMAICGVVGDVDDDANTSVATLPPPPPVDQKLLEAGKAIAAEGMVKYADWWKALTPAQRTNIGKENHNTMKDIATKVKA